MCVQRHRSLPINAGHAHIFCCIINQPRGSQLEVIGVNTNLFDVSTNKNTLFVYKLHDVSDTVTNYGNESNC